MVKAVVLHSGGMDSTTLLYEALKASDEVRAISFNYGQRHKKELEAAAYISGLNGVWWDLIDLTSLGKLLKGSSLSDPDVAVPHGHYSEESMRVTVVPNRNTIMLSCAVGVAIGQGYDEVWAAMHSGDHPIYPDCRPEFINKLNELIPTATESDVKVVTPYINIPKDEIARRGEVLGVPWEQTWSCYEGGEIHCGRCGTCVERQEAFFLAEVDDPTEYKDSEFWKEKTGVSKQ